MMVAGMNKYSPVPLSTRWLPSLLAVDMGISVSVPWFPLNPGRRVGFPINNIVVAAMPLMWNNFSTVRSFLDGAYSGAIRPLSERCV
jgi:hypothetical protein